MKQYFKHRFGYVNVDEEKIYFTESGNWSEARSLHESTPMIKKDSAKKLTIFGTIILIAILAIQIFILADLILTFGLITSCIAFGIYIGAIIFLRYRRNLAPKFLIPKEKLTNVTFSGSYQATFKYLDLENKERIQTIRMKLDAFEGLNVHLTAANKK